LNPVQVEQEVRRWIEVFVVGEGLCPFAARPLQQGLVRISVCAAKDTDGIYRHLLCELDHLLNTPVGKLETTVVAVPQGLASFDDYLDMLAVLQDALAQLQLEGVFQLASFHPHYVFEGTNAGDLSNYTNRSPYPLFHLLREESLSDALEAYPEPEAIPQRNQERMRELGREGILRLLTRASSAQD